MLYFYRGADRGAARAALDDALETFAKENLSITRISDANTPEDLDAALRGGGMFDRGRRITILDNTLLHDEMRATLLAALPHLKKSEERFFILEENPDADTCRMIEKYAESTKRFDAAGRAKDNAIFGLSGALRRADRQSLWIGLQRELAARKAPEAIHGFLFWGAKDMFMRAKDQGAKTRAARLIAVLAELPHESRRRGIELEYALEQFVLSGL